MSCARVDDEARTMRCERPMVSRAARTDDWGIFLFCFFFFLFFYWTLGAVGVTLFRCFQTPGDGF